MLNLHTFRGIYLEKIDSLSLFNFVLQFVLQFVLHKNYIEYAYARMWSRTHAHRTSSCHSRTSDHVGTTNAITGVILRPAV